MFICQACKKVTKLGEKAHKRIIRTRARVYSNGGSGWEITKEIQVCSEC